MMVLKGLLVMLVLAAMVFVGCLLLCGAIEAFFVIAYGIAWVVSFTIDNIKKRLK